MFLALIFCMNFQNDLMHVVKLMHACITFEFCNVFQGETVQRILRIYLDSSNSTSDLLDKLACSILPQVPEFLFYFFLCSLGFFRVLVDDIFPYFFFQLLWIWELFFESQFWLYKYNRITLYDSQFWVNFVNQWTACPP